MSTPLPAAPHYGLMMPSLFPDYLFQTIKARIFAKGSSDLPEWEDIGGSHNAVRYRLQACADYSKEFTESVKHGPVAAVVGIGLA
jgi:hypothetical protein